MNEALLSNKMMTAEKLQLTTNLDDYEFALFALKMAIYYTFTYGNYQNVND